MLKKQRKILRETLMEKIKVKGENFIMNLRIITEYINEIKNLMMLFQLELG